MNQEWPLVVCHNWQFKMKYSLSQVLYDCKRSLMQYSSVAKGTLIILVIKTCCHRWDGAHEPRVIVSV